MTAELRFRVTGEPGAQGSKNAFRNKHTGKINQVESSKRVAPWRQDVVAAAEKAATEQGWQPLPQVRAVIVFGFRRPKSHYRTGRFAHLLREDAPYWHSNKPDADKLARSTLDALTTSGVIGDDCQIVQLLADKIWIGAERAAGAAIILAAPQPRWWFNRTGHCGECGQPGSFCLCTPAKPCACRELHPVGPGLQPDALDVFTAAPPAPIDQDALFGA